MAKSVDPEGADRSGSTLFSYAILSEIPVYKSLGHFLHIVSDKAAFLYQKVLIFSLFLYEKLILLVLIRSTSPKSCCLSPHMQCHVVKRKA